MSQASAIEWTEATWNPVTGCDWVSPGCDHCYARTLAKRMKAMGSVRYQNDGFDRALKVVTPGFGLTLHHDKLAEPLRWRKPRVVFVNSMSDLFHEGVDDPFIEQVWRTMQETPQHTYQILTKRPRRLLAWTTRRWRDELEEMPLPNVWLGTSVENQEWADRRIPLLAQTPAAVRFLSCEPLLGPITIQVSLKKACSSIREAIDWVIVGGESGPKARPVDEKWVRDLRDECVAHGVDFFFKQWGGRTPKAGGRELDGKRWDERPTVLEVSAPQVRAAR
jgi:protein gp37